MSLHDKKKLRKWCVIGGFVALALATLWHFVYDWLPCGFLSVLSPVNESPWEHAKLFLVPPLIWYAVMYFAAGKRWPNYAFSCAVSLVAMPALMLLIYEVCHLLGVDSLPVDIANSAVSIAFGMWLTYRLTVSGWKLSGPVFSAAAAVILIGLLALYAALTYYPPASPLFMDPPTGQYGIPY
jgi:hypothetical protein